MPATTRRASTKQASELDAFISTRRSEMASARLKVTLLRAPFRTLYEFLFVVAEWTQMLVSYVLSHTAVVAVLALLIAAYGVGKLFDGDHSVLIASLEEAGQLTAWWLVLGVLSSIGLGTGLHTFLLYLGPHIAKVTMAASECGSLDFETEGENSFVCPEGVAADGSAVTLWGILHKVLLISFVWGLGTTLGELPPYFVSRAAARSGTKMAELQQLEELEDEVEHRGGKEDISLLDSVKEKLFVVLQRFGFWAILLCASVPNPLFDLAGVTCGHFGIPFWTFFGATAIGKAVIKVQLQALFVITLFHKDNLDRLIQSIETVLPKNMCESIDASLRQSKANFHRAGHGRVSPPKTVVSQCWDALLVLMLGFFLKSIVESSVQERLLRLDEEALAKLKKD